MADVGAGSDSGGVTMGEMTVKDLITELGKYPPGAPVTIEVSDPFYNGDVTYVGIHHYRDRGHVIVIGNDR